MKKISSVVAEIMGNDNIIKAIASKGFLNSMAYARHIKDEVEDKTFKSINTASIATAISRYSKNLKPISLPPETDIQQISVQTNLEGLTYERNEIISQRLRDIYTKIDINNKTYITITQGINEITIIAQTSIIDTFRNELKQYPKIYDIKNLIGITIKFGLKYLKIPNLFYLFIQKLALKNINIVEIVSTATELTFILDKNDMQIAMEQLQKGL